MFVSDIILDALLRGVILTTLAILWVLILVRINGLRSFSKMTNFDFAMTIAVGSMLAGASQSSNWTAFSQTLCAMAMLFVVQFAIAKCRKSSQLFESLMQNKPVLLMRDGEIITDALTHTRVAKSDVIAKLREANVLSFSSVRAVVLETTGDISVLHGDTCSDELLEGVDELKS